MKQKYLNINMTEYGLMDTVQVGSLFDLEDVGGSGVYRRMEVMFKELGSKSKTQNKDDHKQDIQDDTPMLFDNIVYKFP